MAITRSNSNLPFWAPLYSSDAPINGVNQNLFSPGYVFYPNRLTAWDYVIITINGKKVRTPGVAEVRFTRSKEKDKKKPLGEDSTTTTTSGIKAAEVVIELTVNMPEHLQWLLDYGPILFPPPTKDGGKQAVFQVQHPLFKIHKVKSLLVHSIEGPLRHSVVGTKLIKIEATEWLPQSSQKAGATAPPPSLAAETSAANIGLSSQPGANAAKVP